MNELAAKIGALSHELVETNKVQLEVVQAQVTQREQIRELQERVKALSERLGESPAIRKGS
jgi:TolA-binding protein